MYLITKELRFSATLTSDFELAIIQAAELNFPNASHRGCYYHYMQAIWRKVQSLGLAEEYKAENQENQELKKFVQKMAAVSFCPPTFVRPAWLAVQQEAPNLPQVDQLIAYFDHTWLNGQFPCRSWNYFDHPGPRTNNHVEGWHSRMNKVVGKPHPNIYELVDVIKREEATTRMKLQLYETGAALPPRRRRYEEKEKRLQALFERFNAGATTLDDYLEAVKYQTGL